ncbi:MAG: hypothetical protein LBG80_09630 [Bacteroidales bacterium]|jgi:hypothetical protein|nr:hypothetical protein [Bacteroidales bacterium]
MSFSFLEDYKITSEQIENLGVKSTGRLRHQFFSVPEFQIEQALAAFDPFPEELKTFYYEIGFGFMHRRKFGKFSILLDPMSLIYTNKQVNYFATPEVARELKYCDMANQLLFFRTASNQYLAIDRTTVRDKNTVYYRGTVIGKSLYDFLKQYDFNRYALAQQTDEADTEEKIPSATPDIAPSETPAAVPPSKAQNWSTLIDDDDTII